MKKFLNSIIYVLLLSCIAKSLLSQTHPNPGKAKRITVLEKDLGLQRVVAVQIVSMQLLYEDKVVELFKNKNIGSSERIKQYHSLRTEFDEQLMSHFPPEVYKKLTIRTNSIQQDIRHRRIKDSGLNNRGIISKSIRGGKLTGN